MLDLVGNRSDDGDLRPPKSGESKLCVEPVVVPRLQGRKGGHVGDHRSGLSARAAPRAIRQPNCDEPGASVLARVALEAKSSRGRIFVLPQPQEGQADGHGEDTAMIRIGGVSNTMGKSTRNPIDDLRGAARLVIEATKGVTDIVEAMQTGIGGGPAVLGRPLEGPTRLLFAPVYRGIRAVTTLVGGGLDVALARFAQLLGESAPGWSRRRSWPCSTASSATTSARPRTRSPSR